MARDIAKGHITQMTFPDAKNLGDVKENMIKTYDTQKLIGGKFTQSNIKRNHSYVTETNKHENFKSNVRECKRCLAKSIEKG